MTPNAFHLALIAAMIQAAQTAPERLDEDAVTELCKTTIAVLTAAIHATEAEES